jgi:predicted PurR-regulated permease PerM
MPVQLSKWVQILLLIFLLVCGVYFAKPFLVPVLFGGLLAMVLLPVSEKLERKIPKLLAIILSVLLFIAVAAGIISLLSWQMTDLAKDATSIEQKLNASFAKFMEQAQNTLGISSQQQQELFKKQAQSQGKGSGWFSNLFNSTISIAGNSLLCLIYIFLFLYYRSKLKNFILMLVPATKKKEATIVVEEAQDVAQKYLTGLASMILCLWILYGIGFSLVGVKNALFFAVLCGLLEIVPFVGNLTGTAITAVMVLAQGGGTPMLMGVIGTYMFVQFFQTYVLEPLVVGSNVNINPLFTIAGIVLGELVWGVAGMALAIPLLGIIKIICDHVNALKPIGYLIGQEKKERKWVNRFRRFFKTTQ